MTGTDHQNVHSDDRDVNVRAIVASAIGFVLVAAAIHGLVWLLFVFFSGREAVHAVRQYPLAATQETRLPPEPRLQTTPRQDLQDMRAQEDELLNGYRWVDKNAGTVRIPIDQAMRLTLERGLPARVTKDQSR